MQTTTQLKQAIYTALTSNSTISSYVNSTDWIGSNVGQTIPFLTYSIIDDPSQYAFGCSEQYSTVTVQVDLYCAGGGETANADPVVDAIKTAMHSINYRKVGKSESFNVDSDSNVVITRWEKINA